MSLLKGLKKLANIKKSNSKKSVKTAKSKVAKSKKHRAKSNSTKSAKAKKPKSSVKPKKPKSSVKPKKPKLSVKSKKAKSSVKPKKLKSPSKSKKLKSPSKSKSSKKSVKKSGKRTLKRKASIKNSKSRKLKARKKISKGKKAKKKGAKRTRKSAKALKEKLPTFKAIKKISKANALKLVHREDSEKFVKDIAGDEGYLVFEYLLKSGKDVDEFTLADKVGLQINFVRSLLYKLYEHKLVSFSRERDKKKGWFIYSWIAHPERLREILLEKKDEEIVRLKQQALTSQQVFYCNSCNRSYSYADAIENMFFCPVCGSSLEALDVENVKEKVNKKVIQIIKEKNEIKAL